MTEASQLLIAIAQGDDHAAAELLPLVYNELRQLAAAQMAREQPGQTLDATALVHEAYLRLVDRQYHLSWKNCGHFFAAAAEAMRHILIEQARHKKSLRHGGGRRRVDLPDVQAAEQEPDDLLALDEALTKLAVEDAAAVAVVKLRLYAGLSVEEAADSLGISRGHAYRHWTYARAWLRRALRDDDAATS